MLKKRKYFYIYDKEDRLVDIVKTYDEVLTHRNRKSFGWVSVVNMNKIKYLITKVALYLF